MFRRYSLLRAIVAYRVRRSGHEFDPLCAKCSVYSCTISLAARTNTTFYHNILRFLRARYIRWEHFYCAAVSEALREKITNKRTLYQLIDRRSGQTQVIVSRRACLIVGHGPLSFAKIAKLKVRFSRFESTTTRSRQTMFRG